MQGSAVLRRQTRQFIAENPTNIMITRTPQVPDGSGGVTSGDPESVGPVTVRIIEGGFPTGARSLQGEVETPDFVLIGEYQANIKDGDIFQYGDYTLEVERVMQDKTYKVIAKLEKR